MSSDSSVWTEVHSIGPRFRHECCPIVFNHTEILFPRSKTSYSSSTDCALQKYSTTTTKLNNSFIAYPNPPAKSTDLSGFSAAIHTPTNCLYIYSQQRQLMQFNLLSATCRLYSKSPTDIGHSAAALCIGDELHLFGGYNNTKHVVCNLHNISTTACVEFTEVHQFEEYSRYITGGKAVYLSSQNKVLFMGGFDGTKWNDCVYCLAVRTRQWTRLDIKLPEPLSDFGVVLDENERYLVIVGGLLPQGNSEDIYVLDVEQMVFSKSRVIAPHSGECHAVLLGDVDKMHLLLWGYIRGCCAVQYPLKDIMDMLGCWCTVYCQWLHVFCVDDENHARHFKIELDVILNNVCSNLIDL